MAFANTVSLNTNFNVDPYYDDYDETKNFYRMLFRPGFGVQARELTQLQTMLQTQVDRFGEHIFREGSIVKGCEFKLDNSVGYVKLRDEDANGNTVNALSFIGSTVIGGETSVEANVFFASTGDEANDPNLKTLFLHYTQASANGTTKAFASGEQLTISGTSVSCNIATEGVQSDQVRGIGTIFSIGEGIIFAKDHFIYVPEQKIVVDRYSAFANARIGFSVTETIVDDEDDITLTDPASGSYNFAAPGAYRLKLDPVLRTEPLSNTGTVDFVEIAQIESGQLLSYKEKPQYAEIRDYLAKRTFDESGNYTVRGLNVRLREHLSTGNNGGLFTADEFGNTETLSVDVSPGKAYVRGFDIEKLKTNHIQIDKGIDFIDVEDIAVTSQYGNYVLVDEVVGVWDVNLHANVSIRDTSADAISNGDYSTTSAPGSEIGVAKVRSLVRESGTPGDPDAQYRLYLYDVQMTSADFADARSFYFDASGSLADGKADAVLSGGNAVLNETNFRKAVFPTGFSAIRRIKDSTGASDTDYEFMRVFNGLTIANTGVVTATSPNSDELFPYTAGSTVSSPRDKFYLVFNEAANTVVYDGTVAVANASKTVTGTSTNFTDYINPGDVLKFSGYANTFTVDTVDNDTQLTVLESANAAISGASYLKEFPVGKVIDVAGVGSDTAGGSGATRTVTIGTPATTATIDIKEPLNTAVDVSLITSLNKTNATQVAKTLKIKRRVQLTVDSNLGGTTGPWCLGFPDVFRITEVRVQNGSDFTALTQGTDRTSEFELDTGQRDSMYGLGFLKLKSTSSYSLSAGDRILVTLDYFEHDRSGGVGFLSVDSYPVNDTNPANTEIFTQEIPIYTSPVDGARINLRNALDYRPFVDLTATDTDTLGSMTTDPANTHVISSTNITSGQGLRFPRPNENATIDLSFYQGRNDLIVIEPSGDIRSVRGTPSQDPKFPVEPADAMTIAKVRVSPFPSLPSETARTYSRPDLQSAIEPVKNKRYTMKDIGQIAGRVDRLEYYTALNLLEKSAADLFIADVSGNDRFKNGILVDKFSGHGVGAVTDLDYAIAIDRSKSEARPQIKNREVQIQFDSSSSTNASIKPSDVRLTFVGTSTYSNGETITVGSASGTLKYQVGSRLYLEDTSGTFSTGTQAVGSTSSANQTVSAVQTVPNGKAITLPYTHTQFASQPFGTTTRNAAGLFYKWVGDITLNPSNDYWIDTTRNPDVQVNFDLQNSNFLETINPFETEFAFDETLLFGSTTFATDAELSGAVSFDALQSGQDQTISLTTTQQTQQSGLNLAIGMNSQVVPFTDTQSIGDRIIDVNIIPFMRERVIQVTGTGFKPSSRLYAFFDGESVSDYITPMNSGFTANTGTEGSALISDTTGNVYAEFRIPNDDDLRFRVGEKRFRLTDSADNSQRLGIVTTSGEAVYTAEGLQTTVEDTIVSIESPEIVNDLVVEAEAFTEVTDRRTEISSFTVDGRVPPPPPPRRPSGGGRVFRDFGVDGPEPGDGGGSCFVAGTLVTLEDGSKKNIEDVQVGEKLLGQDGAINTVLEHDFPMLGGRDLIGINGSGPFKTPEHPLFTKQGWKAFRVSDTLYHYPHLESIMNGDLEVGDEILQEDGTWMTIESLEVHTNEPEQQVYNFILDGNNTYYANGLLAHNRDPIAQSFTVKDYSARNTFFRSLPGIFLSKIDLFFETKDPNLGCLIEIREVDPTTSSITPKRLPFGKKLLTANDINTSTDGSAPTPVIFSTPIFLRNDIQYAIIVKPQGNNPNTRVFTARLGETDIVTGNRVTKQPALGTLFASANDLQYTPIQEEDMKFNLYRAEFSPTSGTAFFNNADLEYLTVANVSSAFSRGDEIVHGETTLTLGSTVTANVGETANGQTSGTIFDVRTNTGGATNSINVIGTSNNTLSPTPFTPGETINFHFANGLATGQSATLSSQATPTGRVRLYDPRTGSNTQMVLANSSGTFAENTLIKGQVGGQTARIASIDDLIVHRVHPHIEYLQPLGTTYTANGKFALTGSTLDTSFRALNINEAFDFDVKKEVLSASNETNNLSGNKSAQITTSLSTTVSALSPIIHLDRSTLSLTRNFINNDSTNEDSTSGGNAQTRYITKTVTLAEGQDAEDLKVFISAFKPNSATIEVYYKILNDSDEGPIEQRSWTQMSQVTSAATNSSELNKGDFREYEFTVPDAQLTGSGGEVQYDANGVTYTGFKRFAIKIVLLTSNPANPPRMKDFRAIALQV